MEYALWNSWTMRLEYDYLDFGSRSVAMSNIATGQFAENILVRQKAHEVKLGLNYLFNPGNWMPVSPPQKKSSEPQPQRTGLPAPLYSPPFLSGDGPLLARQDDRAPD